MQLSYRFKILKFKFFLLSFLINFKKFRDQTSFFFQLSDYFYPYFLIDLNKINKLYVYSNLKKCHNTQEYVILIILFKMCFFLICLNNQLRIAETTKNSIRWYVIKAKHSIFNVFAFSVAQNRPKTKVATLLMSMYSII